jgi:hypothetical protein
MHTPDDTGYYDVSTPAIENNERWREAATEEAEAQLEDMNSKDIAKNLWGDDARMFLWEFIVEGTQENIANVEYNGDYDDTDYGSICTAVVYSLTEEYIRNRLISCEEEEIIDNIISELYACDWQPE